MAADKNTDKFDPLLRDLSGQIGEAMEAGLSLAMKQFQGVLSLVVDRMATQTEGGTPEKAVLERSAAALRMFSKASNTLPPVAGEFTKTSSHLLMTTGLKLLKAFNEGMRDLR